MARVAPPSPPVTGPARPGRAWPLHLSGDRHGPAAKAFCTELAISSSAVRALSRMFVRRTNPWNIPGYRVSVTGTPASRSRAAYASPSSQSGSYSAVMTRAGGRPARLDARSGDAYGLSPLGLAREVVVPEPSHPLAREDVAGRVLPVGPRVEIVVGDGVDQHLQGQPRPLAVARDQRHHGGEVAARAVASHRDAAPVDPEPLGVGHDPEKGGVRVLDRDGVLRFGSEPVVHAQHGAPGRVRDGPAQPVVGVEVADHPSPAVVVDERGMRPGAARRVRAHGDLAARHGHAVVDHRGDVREGPQRRGAGADRLAASAGVDSSTGFRLSAAIVSMTRWAWGSSGM